MQPEINLGPLTLQTLRPDAGPRLRRRGHLRPALPQGARPPRGLGLRDGVRRDRRRDRRRAAVVDRRELGRGEGRPARLDVLGLRPGVLRRPARRRDRRARLGVVARRARPRRVDVAAVPLAAAYAIGRIGCQLAGDGDYGMAWDGPWAMAYPDGTVPTTEEVHPTPVYETLAMGLRRLVPVAPAPPHAARRAVRALPGAGRRWSASWSSSSAATTPWSPGLTLPQLVALAMMVDRRRAGCSSCAARPPCPPRRRAEPAPTGSLSAPRAASRAPRPARPGRAGPSGGRRPA